MNRRRRRRLHHKELVLSDRRDRSRGTGARVMRRPKASYNFKDNGRKAGSMRRRSRLRRRTRSWTFCRWGGRRNSIATPKSYIISSGNLSCRSKSRRKSKRSSESKARSFSSTYRGTGRRSLNHPHRSKTNSGNTSATWTTCCRRRRRSSRRGRFSRRWSTPRTWKSWRRSWVIRSLLTS